jgi:hypothetical protein
LAGRGQCHYTGGRDGLSIQERTMALERTSRGFLLALVVGLLAFPAQLPTPAEAAPRRGTPVPTVSGPVEGGVRGRPYSASVTDPASFGYVEEEFFVSGTATSFGATPGTAPFRTRIDVLRPADRSRFNGTVVVEWLNVTSTIDAAPLWYLSHEHLIREGFAWVGVSAQRAGIEGSPLSIRFWDPVRYASLDHPGDDFSFDMFSQAGQAVRLGRRLPPGQPDPLGGLRPRRVIAVGQSQSGSRLRTYINEVHEQARVFDGFIPMTAAAAEVRDDVAPVLWVNSETEARTAHRPDGGRFRLWEIAGAAHFSWWGLEAGIAAGQRNQFGDAALPFDRERAAQYGERGGGPCPQNFLPDRYAYNAAVHHMDRWLRGGPPPPPAPRFEREPTTGLVRRDADGNVLGGLRLPPIDVPVATYTGDNCGLFGDTRAFDPLTLASRYPTHAAYVSAMQAATGAAVAAGHLLPTDAEELMARAEASTIGS